MVLSDTSMEPAMSDWVTFASPSYTTEFATSRPYFLKRPSTFANCKVNPVPSSPVNPMLTEDCSGLGRTMAAGLAAVVGAAGAMVGAAGAGVGAAGACVGAGGGAGTGGGAV